MPQAERGRAMGLIVWGATIGSILGPNLMPGAVRAGALLGLSPIGSAFLISVAATASPPCSCRRCSPRSLAIARQMEQEMAGVRIALPARPLGEIFTEPRARIAVGTLMVSQIVMIGTTSTSPVYLHDQGHAVSTIGSPCRCTSAACTWPRRSRVAVRSLRPRAMIVAGALGLLLAVIVAGIVPAARAGS